MNLWRKSMKLLNTHTLDIKKSKFIAYFYQISSKEEVKEIYETLKKENKKARHIPYAYLLPNTAGKTDDKEPSGTSGIPIYQVLERNHLTNHAIFVVRYFGGTKLGAGPLMRAYHTSAIQVTEKNDCQTP